MTEIPRSFIQGGVTRACRVRFLLAYEEGTQTRQGEKGRETPALSTPVSCQS